MGIDISNGVIEIGNILWGSAIARTNVATEAFFLMADYVLNLGYRRLEWKCDSANLPSRKAAERFGFTYEGLFRQHVIVKGCNRDTTWYSIIDSEWSKLRNCYRRWLDHDNFDESGKQIYKLRFFQTSL